MEINDLIEKIAGDSECRLFPAVGMPVATNGFPLPIDLVTFYKSCGGMELFPDGDFGFRIVGPEEFVPANSLLLGNFYLKNREEMNADESSAWYLIAREVKTNEAITIDLNLAKIGFCYDSFHEVYGSGNSKVVARSFTELIELLYLARGKELYWEQSYFDMGFARD